MTEMTDSNTLLRAIMAGDATVVHSPASRGRAHAAGRLVALTYLEETARPGDMLIEQLADAARAVPGAWAGYPLLHGMEADGLVTASTNARSPRRMYEITAAGRDAAAALRACLTEYVSAA